MTRLLLSLVALSSLASAVFLGLLLRQGLAEAEAARSDRTLARQERDTWRQQSESDAAWAKREVWATGFYLRDKLNAEHALRLERERCGAW